MSKIISCSRRKINDGCLKRKVYLDFITLIVFRQVGECSREETLGNENGQFAIYQAGCSVH